METRNFSEIVDPRLEKHFVESEMSRMVEAAAACVRHSAPKRPRMFQVITVPNNYVELPSTVCACFHLTCPSF